MSWLNRFFALFHRVMESAPWLFVHDLWLYVLVALGVFVVLWLVDMFSLRYLARSWNAHIR